MEQGKELTAMKKTQMYLDNYREMVRYTKEAVSEVTQVKDISRYNISAEKAFLQYIRECRAETIILIEHINKAMESLKEDAKAAGEEYKFDALEAVYVKGESYEDIMRETGCGKNTPKKWCRVMIERLSIKLFGAKAIEKQTKIIKTGVKVG
jgi:hypothetical protein